MSPSIERVLATYDQDRLCVVTAASHSALQILHGAKKEGFVTIVVTTPDRAKFYGGFSHFIDQLVVVDSWPELCEDRLVEKLCAKNAILVPHASIIEYVGLRRMEKIGLPIFGLRSLFRWEADQHRKMELLEFAGIPVPKTYGPKEDPDTPVIVKLPGAKGGKGYFVAKTRRQIAKRLHTLVKQGAIKRAEDAIIQEYLVGVTAYYHYFYSPVLGRLEILGADIRYESDVDGFRRLPPHMVRRLEPAFTVVGNLPLVVRESLLPKILEYGTRFCEATRIKVPPGMIGPFCLESVIDRDMNIKVFEFSGRIVAGTNLYVDGSPYSYLYWDEPMSTGRRIAREIRLAAKKGVLGSVLT